MADEGGWPPADPPPGGGGPGWGVPGGGGPGWGTPGSGGPGWGTPGGGGPGWGGPGWGGGWPPSPRPGVIPLRPLQLGEILDGAFTIMRRYWQPVFGLTAAIIAVTGVVSFLLALLTRDSTAGGVAAGVINALLDVIGSVLVEAVVVAITASAVLGRPVTAGEVVARIRGQARTLSLLAVTLLLVISLASLLLIIPGIYLGVALTPAVAVCLLERTGVRQAMRRSWQLSRGSWWRMFGILLLAAIIMLVASFIISLPFEVVLGVGALTTGATSSTAVLFGAAVISTITAILTRPFAAAVAALLYVDLRMRREGFDVTLSEAAAAGGGL